MADGLSLTFFQTASTNDGSGHFLLSNSLTSDPYHVSLNNYAAWLTLQPYSMIAAILDVTANELYRRQEWTTIAGQVKEAGKDLRAVAR